MIKISDKVFLLSDNLEKESIMKVKLSWIPFILFTPVLVGLALYTSIFPDAEQLFMGFGVSILPYAIAGVTLVMFLFCLLFKAVDRKTADYYVIKRNVPAGLFGLITAATIAAEGGISLLQAKSSGELSAYAVVYVAFTLLSALAIVIMSLMHITKTTSSKGLSVYLLMPAIWSAIKLVNVFVSNAEISLANTDVLQLLTLIAVTLYLFFYAQLVSAIRSKGTLKNTIVMGLISVSLLIASSSVPIYNIVLSGVIPEIFSLVPLIQNIALILYIFSFVAELSSQALRKDEMKVIIAGEDISDYDYDDKKSRKAEKRAKKEKKRSKKNVEEIPEAEDNKPIETYGDELSNTDTVREQVSPSNYDDIYSEDDIISFSNESSETNSIVEETTVPATSDTSSDEDKLRLSEVVISEIEKENEENGTTDSNETSVDTNESAEDKMKRIDQLIFQLETDDKNV